MGLSLQRALSRAALWVERVWPAIWPALGVAGLYAAFALFDLPRELPGWGRLAVLAVVVVAIVGLLWRGLGRMTIPTREGADRRLENTSGLRHRPLAVLADRPSRDDPDALLLWRAHQARMKAASSRLRVGAPHPGLPARDPVALRAAVVVALVAGIIAAGSEAPNRLRAALLPPLRFGPSAPSAQVEAWVTPPAYTGLAPRFLRAAEPSVEVPTGSHLVVGVTGGEGTPSIDIVGHDASVTALDEHSFRTEQDLTQSGRLVVSQRGGTVASWALTVIPDRPPTASWSAPPGPAAREQALQTRLPWQTGDDYGVVSLKVELRLAERPDAPPLIAAIGVPMGVASRDAHGVVIQDFSAHPWAGLGVTARLVAQDAIGQTGQSDVAPFTLPERVFNHPVARELVSGRKLLSLHPDAREAVADATDHLTDAPGAYDNAPAVTIELGAIMSMLKGRAVLEQAQARMWSLALQLEENAAERTAQALEAARERTREAMEAARDKQADSPEQQALDQRLQELRDAIDRHLEALAEQARRDGTELPYDYTAPHMNKRDMDRMTDTARDQAKQDRMADAEKQIQELEKLLDELQSGRPEHGEERAENRRQQGRQQMGAVQDMVRREGSLMDTAQGRTSQPARPSPDSPARAGEGRQQRALRRALGELMQRFGDLTGEIPPSLSDADTAMREAGQALASGSDPGAASAELRAIQALQKGAQQMGQQMARQFGQGEPDGDDGDEAEMGQGDNPGDNPGDGMGDGQPGTRRRDGLGGRRPNQRGEYRPQRRAQTDPLGRDTRQQGANGNIESGDTRVPEEMERVRTRELQEELRRREGERTRPPAELDYIDRLLKPY